MNRVRIHYVPARLRPRFAPFVARAQRSAHAIFPRVRGSMRRQKGQRTAAQLGGLFVDVRAYIACDVCTTGRWYPRTALRRAVPSREQRTVGATRETRTEVETPRRIGKGALSAYRRPSSPPETRLAACGFALPLFASFSFSPRERCLSLISPFTSKPRGVAPLEDFATLLACLAEVVARSRRRCMSMGCPRSTRGTNSRF